MKEGFNPIPLRKIREAVLHAAPPARGRRCGICLSPIARGRVWVTIREDRNVGLQYGNHVCEGCAGTFT